MTSKIFICILLSVLLYQWTYGQELLWSVETDTNGIGHAHHQVLDSYSNVYVASGTSINLIKFDQDGEIQFASDFSQESQTYRMILGPNNVIYIAGKFYVGSYSRDAMIQAYSDEGSLIFSEQYDRGGENERFNDISYGLNDALYCCGYSSTQLSNSAIIAKYTIDGEMEWVKYYDSTNNGTYADHIRVGTNGDLHIIGKRPPATSWGSAKLLYLRYNNNGDFISECSQTMSGYTGCFPFFSIIDQENNLYTGGTLMDQYGLAGFVCKISNDSVQWHHVLTSSYNVSIESGILDDSGNLFICGGYREIGTDGYIVKFSSDGIILEEVFNDNPTGGDCFFTSMDIYNDEIYVCGNESNDIVIANYDNDLNLIWDYMYDGGMGSEERVSNIKLDQGGSIYISGRKYVEYTDTIMALVQKYSNLVGIEQPDRILESIDLFPNPARNVLYIRHPKKNHYCIAEIYDLFGHRIDQIIIPKNQNQVNIDVSAIPSGVYIAVLKSETGILARRKFVKR